MEGASVQVTNPDHMTKLLRVMSALGKILYSVDLVGLFTVTQAFQHFWHVGFLRLSSGDFGWLLTIR